LTETVFDNSRLVVLLRMLETIDRRHCRGRTSDAQITIQPAFTTAYPHSGVPQMRQANVDCSHRAA